MGIELTWTTPADQRGNRILGYATADGTAKDGADYVAGRGVGRGWGAARDALASLAARIGGGAWTRWEESEPGEEETRGMTGRALLLGSSLH